jgi:hypothetical protein
LKVEVGICITVTSDLPWNAVPVISIKLAVVDLMDTFVRDLIFLMTSAFLQVLKPGC